MDNKTAKKYVESLIFSSLEPLSKADIKKMLSEYGSYDLEKILEELMSDYRDRGINLSNVDPLDRFGPLPFELEIGTRWYVPVITKYSFGYTSTWIRISSYFQAW